MSWAQNMVRLHRLKLEINLIVDLECSDKGEITLGLQENKTRKKGRGKFFQVFCCQGRKKGEQEQMNVGRSRWENLIQNRKCTDERRKVKEVCFCVCGEKGLEMDRGWKDAESKEEMAGPLAVNTNEEKWGAPASF